MLRKCANPLITGDASVLVLIASMRPEHGCSGNVCGRLQDLNQRTGRRASMRPEHGCSGNERRITGVDDLDVLASMRP